MKSFTASSFPTENAELLERARQMVHKNPQALFTDFQWFLYRSRNTVYFTAFSHDSYDRERLHDVVTQMVSLAPQLSHGFKGATPGLIFPKKMIDAITTVEETDSFEGYPDKWLSTGQEIFDQPDLPLFRVRVVNLKGGAKEDGRASMIMVQSSHALMEGSDSALLTRTQPSGHGVMAVRDKKVPFLTKFGLMLGAALMAPGHIISAHILSPEKKEMGFRSTVIERAKLRRVANHLGVRQRSLMFALVMGAVNEHGKAFGESVNTVYTSLDGERQELDDDFFRVRSITAKFDFVNDIKEMIGKVDGKIEDIEKKDNSKMQFVLNAMFKTHRIVAKFLPFIYNERFFRYNGNYNMVLTMIPPHHTYGDLTRSIEEPIFCGSYHVGSNLCTFVPGRKFVTVNYAMQTKYLTNVDRAIEMLDQLDAEIPKAG